MNQGAKKVNNKKANGSGAGGSNIGSQRISPAVVEKYLKGIKYPSNKNALIKKAEENKAPEDVMGILNRFRTEEYYSTIDVSKEIGAVR